MLNRFLSRIPWFLSAGAVLVLAIVLAVVANVLFSPYFERSFLDEASPLVDASGGVTGEGSPVAAPTPPVSAPTVAKEPTVADRGDTAGVLLRGTVRDGEPGHNGEGTALLLRDESGQLFLRFEEFSVTNGPDLFVILSTDPDAYVTDGSINLGGLKATDGNINYEIPADADISGIRSVVVWCRSFDVDFAVATLEPAT